MSQNKKEGKEPGMSLPGERQDKQLRDELPPPGETKKEKISKQSEQAEPEEKDHPRNQPQPPADDNSEPVEERSDRL